MFFVHEIHALTPAGAPRYETLLRELWGPALAGDRRTRLVWCVRSIPGSHALAEIVTMTGVADGSALAELGARTRGGDLRAAAATLAAGRVGITRRVLAPLRFNRYAPDLAALPETPAQPSDALYIHDFVPPRTGMQRSYEDAMEQVFLRALDVEYADFSLWGGFETVAGGGEVPESVMITGILRPAAGTQLLGQGNPRESVKPGAWLYDSLKLRDTWTSRLVRTLPWSPTA